MISITNLAKAFGGDTLFEGASFQLNAGSRYGLVGANGSGKSTFLKILAGDEVASDGIINMPRRARMGVLKQDHFQYEDVPIVQVAMMGKKDVWDALEERERLLAHMDGDFDSDRYAELGVPFNDQTLARDLFAVSHLLALAPAGTLVITYNGFGGALPRNYEQIAVDVRFACALRLWRKRGWGAASPGIRTA